MKSTDLFLCNDLSFGQFIYILEMLFDTFPINARTQNPRQCETMGKTATSYHMHIPNVSDIPPQITRRSDLALFWPTIFHGEPGSSVGIATDYGLDGPGSNPCGDEIFRPSRLALGPTQLPVK